MAENFQVPSRAAAVTPSDATTFNISTAFKVGVAGDVAVLTEGGDTVVIPAVQPGQVISLRFTQIRATGTTATGIVRFW